MNYIKQKRSQSDFCNICEKYETLTWDHVPPKSCNNKYNIKVNALFDGIPEENKYQKEYQNGIRYRSICSKCNNALLGSHYDVELDKFTEQVQDFYLQSLQYPQTLQ